MNPVRNFTPLEVAVVNNVNVRGYEGELKLLLTGRGRAYTQHSMTITVININKVGCRLY